MTLDSETEASVTKADVDSTRLLTDGFCGLGLVAFLVSWFLPSVQVFQPTVGYFCLLFGFYWWPSNLTLLLSPFLSRTRKRWVPLTAFVIVSLTLIVNVAMGVNKPHEVFVGYWLWTFAYALMAGGLAVRVASLGCGTSPAARGPSLGIGSEAALESGPSIAR